MGEIRDRTTSITLAKDLECCKWVAVLTMWMYSFVHVALFKGLGILLPTLQDQFQTKTWVLGGMASVVAAMSGIVGVFAGVLRRRFEGGVIMTVCGTMIGLAAIVGSFTVTESQLSLTYMLLAGTGLGISSVLSEDVVARCFVENHTTAVGIARTGSSIALIVGAPLMQFLVDTYGWSGAMLLMGGIFSNLTVCGALMRGSGTPKPCHGDYREIPTDSSSARHSTSQMSGCKRTLGESLEANLDLRLLIVDVRFWTAASMYSIAKFLSEMWRIYFVSFAVSKDFSLKDASTFAAVAGGGDLIGKIAQGFVVDRGILSSWSVMSLAVGVGAVSYITLPWMTSYWSMMVTAFFLQTAAGPIICPIDGIIKQMLGVELLASAFGWIGLITTILRFTLGFLPGLMYDNSGSYSGAFVFLGCLQATSFIALSIIRYKQLL